MYRGRFLSLHNILDVAGAKAIAYGGLQFCDVSENLLGGNVHVDRVIRTRERRRRG